MNKLRSAKRFTLGALIAAVAGFVAGLLTAPKSGKETREDIKETTDKVKNETERELKMLYDELGDLLKEAKDKGHELSDKAPGALEEVVGKSDIVMKKAREVLAAAKGGETDDKDLQRAVKEATKAVQHLRNYLKKS